MKWLKSTTNKSYTVNGKVIPPVITPDNKYLQLEDSEYQILLKNAVVASLVKGGYILTTDTEPVTTDKTKLIASNEGLQARNRELEAQLEAAQKEAEAYKTQLENGGDEALKAAKAETEALRAEATQELQDMQAKLEAAQKELEKLKAKKS